MFRKSWDGRCFAFVDIISLLDVLGVSVWEGGWGRRGLGRCEPMCVLSCERVCVCVCVCVCVRAHHASTLKCLFKNFDKSARIMLAHLNVCLKISTKALL